MYYASFNIETDSYNIVYIISKLLLLNCRVC